MYKLSSVHRVDLCACMRIWCRNSSIFACCACCECIVRRSVIFLGECTESSPVRKRAGNHACIVSLACGANAWVLQVSPGSSMQIGLPRKSTGAEMAHAGGGGRARCARWASRTARTTGCIPANCQKNEAARQALGSALGLHFLSSIHPFSTCKNNKTSIFFHTQLLYATIPSWIMHSVGTSSYQRSL